MSTSFTFFDVVLILGFLQGLIISVLLFTSNKNQRSNRFLAWGILVAALLCYKVLQHTLGFWETTYGRYLPLAIDLTGPPLFFLYFSSLITPPNKPVRHIWWHLLPTLLLCLHAMLVYVFALSETGIEAKQAIADQWYYNSVKTIEDILVAPVSIAYFLASYWLFRRFKNAMRFVASPRLLLHLRWIEGLFIMLFLLVIWATIVVFLNFGLGMVDTIFWPLQIQSGYMVVVIYGLGVIAYLQPQLSEDEKAVQEEISTAPAPLSADRVQEIYPAVLAAMKNDQVFLDPTLNLSNFAKRLQYRSTEVSKAIKQQTDKNFKEFINAHRLDMVLQKLTDPACDHLSILGIAFESGFNSEATFYRIFKKAIGQSPAEFRRQHRKV